MKKISNAICKIIEKVSDVIERRFDITLSLRRKKDAEKPILSVNVKGEIPREVVALFAIIGAFTFLCSIIKLFSILKRRG